MGWVRKLGSGLSLKDPHKDRNTITCVCVLVCARERSFKDTQNHKLANRRQQVERYIFIITPLLL